MIDEMSECPYPAGTENRRIWMEAFSEGEASGFDQGYFAAAVDTTVATSRNDDTDAAVEAVEREFHEEEKRK